MNGDHRFLSVCGTQRCFLLEKNNSLPGSCHGAAAQSCLRSPGRTGTDASRTSEQVPRRRHIGKRSQMRRHIGEGSCHPDFQRHQESCFCFPVFLSSTENKTLMALRRYGKPVLALHVTCLKFPRNAFGGWRMEQHGPRFYNTFDK